MNAHRTFWLILAVTATCVGIGVTGSRGAELRTSAGDRPVLRTVSNAPPAVTTVDQALAAEHYLLPDYTFRKGDSAAAFAAGPRQLSGTLLIGGQEHFYLE